MIEIKNLSKKFGDLTVLDNVSLNAEGILGVCGDAGSGKSTLLGIIAGVIPATEGQILINERELPVEPVAMSKAVGYLVQGSPVFSELTTYQFLTFIGEAKKIPKEKLFRQIDEVIELAELTRVKDVYITHLSQSDRKIIGIAQTLLGNPKIVVLDEPFADLDAGASSTMKAIIKMLGEIKTVVISSKAPSDISSVCDSIVVLSGGRIAEQDNSADKEGE